MKITSIIILIVLATSSNCSGCWKIPKPIVTVYDDGWYSIQVPWEGRPDKIGVDYTINNADFQNISLSLFVDNVNKQFYGTLGDTSKYKFQNLFVKVGDIFYYKVTFQKDDVECKMLKPSSITVTELVSSKKTK